MVRCLHGNGYNGGMKNEDMGVEMDAMGNYLVLGMEERYDEMIGSYGASTCPSHAAIANNIAWCNTVVDVRATLAFGRFLREKWSLLSKTINTHSRKNHQ